MAVCNLACIAFRPEALDVHDWVNQKFKDHNLIDASPYTYPCITIFIKICKVNTKLFCFFMWFARFQILISEPQSIWCSSFLYWVDFMYISKWMYFVTGLNLVLQRPSTTTLAKTKADIVKKELLLLLVSLVYSKTRCSNSKILYVPVFSFLTILYARFCSFLST